MEYRDLERLGISVSLLGYGCMRFPTKDDGKIDRMEAEKLIDTAYENGINYFDTAYFYHEGESEPFVGSALSKYKRSTYYVATKLPPWQVNSLEDASRIFNKQLKRLDMDYIDFYLLHSLNKKMWDKMVRLKVPEFYDELKKQGKIKYFGFSFHDDYEVFEEILNHRQWDFCQIQLNYMDTMEQAGIKGYHLAQRLGIPVVVMEPVKGGLLASLPDDISHKLKENKPDASVASWALRWVANLPNVKVVLSGMSSREQLEDNLKTFNVFKPLDLHEQNIIEDISKTLKSRVNNGCTGCNYCMPCPKGVDIPYNFRIWNNYGIYQNRNSALQQWENEIPDNQKAANCVSCGLCEKVCPQKIEIRNDLKRLQKEFERL